MSISFIMRHIDLQFVGTTVVLILSVVTPLCIFVYSNNKIYYRFVGFMVEISDKVMYIYNLSCSLFLYNVAYSFELFMIDIHYKWKLPLLNSIFFIPIIYLINICIIKVVIKISHISSAVTFTNHRMMWHDLEVCMYFSMFYMIVDLFAIYLRLKNDAMSDFYSYMRFYSPDINVSDFLLNQIILFGVTLIGFIFPVQSLFTSKSFKKVLQDAKENVSTNKAVLIIGVFGLLVALSGCYRVYNTNNNNNVDVTILVSGCVGLAIVLLILLTCHNLLNSFVWNSFSAYYNIILAEKYFRNSDLNAASDRYKKFLASPKVEKHIKDKGEFFCNAAECFIWVEDYDNANTCLTIALKDSELDVYDRISINLIEARLLSHCQKMQAAYKKIRDAKKLYHDADLSDFPTLHHICSDAIMIYDSYKIKKEYIDSLFEEAKDDMFSKALATQLYATVDYHRGKYESTIEQCDMCLSYVCNYSKVDEPLLSFKANIYSLKGCALFFLANQHSKERQFSDEPQKKYREAINAFNCAINIISKNSILVDLLSPLLAMVGLCHKNINEINKAVYYAKKAYKVCTKNEIVPSKDLLKLLFDCSSESGNILAAKCYKKKLMRYYGDEEE